MGVGVFKNGTGPENINVKVPVEGSPCSGDTCCLGLRAFKTEVTLETVNCNEKWTHVICLKEARFHPR